MNVNATRLFCKLLCVQFSPVSLFTIWIGRRHCSPLFYSFRRLFCCRLLCWCVAQSHTQTQSHTYGLGHSHTHSHMKCKLLLRIRVLVPFVVICFQNVIFVVNMEFCIRIVAHTHIQTFTANSCEASKSKNLQLPISNRKIAMTKQRKEIGQIANEMREVFQCKSCVHCRDQRNERESTKRERKRNADPLAVSV